MAERFKAPVLKTGELVRVPGVRIPLHPLDQPPPQGENPVVFSKSCRQRFLFGWLRGRSFSASKVRMKDLCSPSVRDNRRTFLESPAFTPRLRAPGPRNGTNLDRLRSRLTALRPFSKTGASFKKRGSRHPAPPWFPFSRMCLETMP